MWQLYPFAIKCNFDVIFCSSATDAARATIDAGGDGGNVAELNLTILELNAVVEHQRQIIQQQQDTIAEQKKTIEEKEKKLQFLRSTHDVEKVVMEGTFTKTQVISKPIAC